MNTSAFHWNVSDLPALLVLGGGVPVKLAPRRYCVDPSPKAVTKKHCCWFEEK